jgi:hypothetical protein
VGEAQPRAALAATPAAGDTRTVLALLETLFPKRPSYTWFLV